MTFFKDFYLSLTPQEQKAFAERAGTTKHYIRYNLLSDNPALRRVPSKDLISGMVKAGKGEVTYLMVLAEIIPELKQEFYREVRSEAKRKNRQSN